ncbi:hypothetical protein [Jeongeupia naejangsanensis]|uniref:Uncharacterized protein n=1 Tax=Jeongeupia naejangsanensis TaxID=613195 RepID=A0ABS2BN24_9NEIS|nr:hypothetical protein [Jeongeupia naejangsanensis]MBM3117011.1 hypothetical protein [Jeongeupia naejangsanensis]
MPAKFIRKIGNKRSGLPGLQHDRATACCEISNHPAGRAIAANPAALLTTVSGFQQRFSGCAAPETAQAASTLDWLRLARFSLKEWQAR